MGNTDRIVVPWYKEHIKPEGATALLGFTNNRMFRGDLYDRELLNFDINGHWSLPKKYKTIICLRTAYFACYPQGFIQRCYDNLEEGGKLYVDWGYGDQWRFKNFKVGWLKNGEHEFAYAEENKLWSGVWSDVFRENPCWILFEHECINRYGYKDVRQAVFDEVPSLMKLDAIRKNFDIKWDMFCTTKPYLQLYVLISGVKK